MDKNSQVYVSYMARFKEVEAVKLLLKEDRYMTYNTYKKHNLKYGHINESAFNSLKRQIHKGTGNYIANMTKEDITHNYKNYLLELKVKREKAYKEAKRKLKECNDMINYLEHI